MPNSVYDSKNKLILDFSVVSAQDVVLMTNTITLSESVPNIEQAELVKSLSSFLGDQIKSTPSSDASVSVFNSTNKGKIDFRVLAADDTELLRDQLEFSNSISNAEQSAIIDKLAQLAVDLSVQNAQPVAAA